MMPSDEAKKLARGYVGLDIAHDADTTRTVTLTCTQAVGRELVDVTLWS